MIYILTILVIAAFIAFVYVQSSGYDIVEYDLHTDKNIGSTVSFVMLSDLHDTDVTHDGNKKAGENHRQSFKTILLKRQSIRFARNRPTRHDIITPIRPGTMNE